jgi:tRNA A37 methylthiotransferase MiaB
VKDLVEEQKKENCIGRSEHYKIVEFKSKKNLLGKIVAVKIVESKEWVLKGE